MYSNLIIIIFLAISGTWRIHNSDKWYVKKNVQTNRYNIYYIVLTSL